MTVLSMSHEELWRFDTLQRVERRELGADDAALLLGVLRRQVFRMLATMRERGAEGLVSGKPVRPSNRRLSPMYTETAIALVREHIVISGRPSRPRSWSSSTTSGSATRRCAS